jgi:hypothetical protein
MRFKKRGTLQPTNEVAVAVAEAETLRRAEEVQVCDVRVEISTEPSGTSECFPEGKEPASPMEASQGGDNGCGTLTEVVIAVAESLTERQVEKGPSVAQLPPLSEDEEIERVGELSISGFEITVTNDVVLPDNISCPLEVEEQIRDHLRFFANRFRLQEEAKKRNEYGKAKADFSET